MEVPHFFLCCQSIVSLCAIPLACWGMLAFLFAPSARSRLMAEPLSSLASPSLPYWRCCDALPKGIGCELRAAEGGGWRTRGRSGSSAASVVPLAETLSAEGPGLLRPIDLRAADATTPRRTVRASTRRPTPQRHTADFHLSQNEKLDFTICLQACRSFARQKIGEPPGGARLNARRRRRQSGGKASP